MGRALLFSTFLTTVAAPSATAPLPETVPEIPQPDLTFLREVIPAEALTVQPGGEEPTARWDRDGDGVEELQGEWDPDAEQFGTWTILDPATATPRWRVLVSHRRQPPWQIEWDSDGDGLMDWTLVDANRDGRPEEALWNVGGGSAVSARFLDRDGDGRFEARCWVNLTVGDEKSWAFDEDGDGVYERSVDGATLTENGYDPAWARRVLEADPSREDLHWELIGWCERQGDEAGWRRHVLAYAADPEGERFYELTYRPILRRLFHTDPAFRDALLGALRSHCERPDADYGTLWALGELLRWQSTPPEVAPDYLAQWRESIGLPASAEIPTAVDPQLVRESDRWFKRSLASEMMTRAARENVALRLARLYAAQGAWDLVHQLCGPILQHLGRQQGPMSERHLEVANIAFAYGDADWAQELYRAMATHWIANPGDPSRAGPNHTALIRLGLLALHRDDLGQARYFLMRALDSLTPEVASPDTVLALQLLEHSETRAAAEEYLAAVERRAAGRGTPGDSEQ